MNSYRYIHIDNATYRHSNIVSQINHVNYSTYSFIVSELQIALSLYHSDFTKIIYDN